MQRWYYSVNGRDVGPVSSAKVADAVLRRELELDSYVISEKTKVWTRIKEIPEIMDIIHEPAAHPIFNEEAAKQFGEFMQKGITLDELNRSEPLYYNFPASKLFKWQLLTFGLFGIYWFYRQWLYMITNKKIMRGSWLIVWLDRIIFAYVIFHGIESDREMLRYKRPAWNAITLALLWYLGLFLAMFLPYTASSLIGVFLNLMVPLLIASLMLIPVQRYINEVNVLRKMNPDAAQNKA